MVVLDLRLGDRLRLRKQHPCGSRDWEVVRLGADIGLVCSGCGHKILMDRLQLLAANSIFVLTINATFAVGFGFLGPLLLKVAGTTGAYIVVATMFGLAAAAILPLPGVPPERRQPAAEMAGRAARQLVDELRDGIAFVRRHGEIAWSLTYLGIAASLIGVMGAIGPGYAVEVLRLTEEDFFFVMGPAGLGAVVGILFINSYARHVPK